MSIRVHPLLAEFGMQPSSISRHVLSFASSSASLDRLLAGARLTAETSMLSLFAVTMDRDSFQGRVSCLLSENPISSVIRPILSSPLHGHPVCRANRIMASPLTLLEPAELEIARYGNCHSISMRSGRAPNGEEPCFMHGPIGDREEPRGDPFSFLSIPPGYAPIPVMGQSGTVIAGPKTWSTHRWLGKPSP